ncbi:MAG: efflux RND transporter permease subunit [Bacteroidales bacterium]|nr:efflux RND transporter permease subunit [Bacteroidales bacterium]MDD4602391.1 efflux RND transporter permease subunit [Bacteroidales bacterium]
MKLPEIGVKHPVFTVMVFIAVLLFGIVSLKMLPTDVLPDIELPTLTVITVYPGASANEVEQQVTKKLEETLSGSENLKKITSKSKENVSFITLQYQWSSDLNEASANARDLIELAKRRLPDGAEDPTIFQINSSMLPVIIYGVNAKESYAGISKILEEKITNPLKKLPGVGTVLIIGQPTREITVNVNPDKLKAYHISVSQIAQNIKLDNINIPGGSIKVGINEFALRIPGEFSNLSEIENMALASFNGKIIRLRDIAEIKDGFKEKDEIIRVNDKHAIGLLVQKQSGANTVNVATELRKEVTRIQKTLPPDVEIKELMDSSALVSSSISNLTETISYAALFVVLIVFLFLRNYRSSLIIILSIPFSLIVAFIYMYFANYTVNIFSLMSLAVAIGVVVDNAIVVLDNISRHIEKGEKPKQAAIFATSEMGLAISASTFTIIAVFLPMVFMGGLVGIMFKQLAILTSVTLLASLVTSLLLTPMMASKLLKSAEEEKKKKHGKLYQASENIFIALENAYKKGLEWSIRHRVIVISTCLGLFVITLFLAKNVGTDYIPEFDAGDITLVFQTEVGTNAQETERVAKQVEGILKEEVPELTSFFTIVGQTEDGLLTSIGFKEGKNISTIMAKIVPPEKRKRSSKDIANKLRKRLEKIPEIEKCNVSGGSFLSTALLGNIRPIQINLMGNDLKELNAAADSIKTVLKQNPHLTNIETTVDNGKMEIQIDIDQQKAANMGLNSAMIALQVRQSIYGAEAGNFKQEGDEYKIIVRYDSTTRNNIERLNSIMLSTLTGQQIPISAVATINRGVGPLEIARESQQRVVTLMSDLKGVSLGDATKEVNQQLNKMQLSKSVDVSLGGQVTEQKESFSSLIIMFIVGVFLVYMIMASQFESFKDPFIILFTIPLSIIGVIWAFLLTGISLSVVTFVAMIMLIGIDVNNGIILVDYTNMMRKRGHGLLDAAAESGRLRLRPVLMTSLTAILGMIPLAASSGMGSEIWSPFGVTCIGGLLVSKFFTMFLIPTLYVSFNKKALKKEPVI